MIVNYHERLIKEVKLRNLLNIFLWGNIRQKYDVEVVDFFHYFFIPFDMKNKLKFNQILENNKTMKILRSIPNQIIVFKFLEGVERNVLLLDLKAITRQNTVIEIRDKEIDALKRLEELHLSIGILLYFANLDEKFYLDTPYNIVQNSTKRIKNERMQFYVIDVSKMFTLSEFLEYHYGIDTYTSKKAINEMLKQIENNEYFEVLRPIKSQAI